ncbi:sulfite exporter TauE/SafE family protein [Taklimakanibacter lacteus]|uniref:sulfite exporter TauE/SafE family protein n=1 Tax=Taklimakanibacter lacteus TaxID=2268456 RepID=UPI000E6664BC
MSLVTLGLGSLFVFLAAIVRGYSGFGFSLLVITSLSLLMAPSTFIPSIFMLEIAASIHMLPGIWRDIHWRSLAPLIIGCAIGTPLGVWLLANVPVPPMQIALAVFVLTATWLLWRGFALKTMPGTAASGTVGAASGLFNGAFGIGGPPVILFYFASPAGNVAGRASLIAYFMLTDLIGLAFLSREELITRNSLYLALLFLPALVLGIWIGSKSFRRADPLVFRKLVLVLLAGLAILTAAQGIFALWQN